VSQHASSFASTRPEYFFFDRDELVARGRSLHGAFRDNEPFPHVVMDDFLPPAVVARLVDEFPAPEAAPFEQPDNEHQVRKLGRLQEKDFAGVSPFTRQVLAELNSMAMLDFLEALTGIEGLVADPHFFGGALHQVLPGGRLEVHADFSRDVRRNLDRRLNLLLYLNPVWDDAWGGHLELWDADMRACRARIAPVANRCVVFATSSTSFHGHPEPLACPEGTTRRSLALYFYTASGDSEVPLHNTLWQDRARAATDTETPGSRAWRDVLTRRRGRSG
jgi:Rps23 Pro-64 3,4-dihydroxylase Tpa1-like proline 4-hydroxylase